MDDPTTLSDMIVSSECSGCLTIATHAVGSFSRCPMKCPSRFSYLRNSKKSDEPSTKETSTNGLSWLDLSSINWKDGIDPKDINIGNL